MNDVPAGSELVGERANPFRQSLGMVEEQNFCHLAATYLVENAPNGS